MEQLKQIVALWLNKKTSQYLTKKWGLNTDRNEVTKRKKLKRGDVKVTDHAVLRYFERMEGYNIDEVYELIGKGVKKTDGMSKQVNADMTVVVEGDTIVTLYRNEYKAGNGIKGFENIKRESI